MSTPPPYAYSYSPQLSPWIGRFESRVLAEEAARDGTFDFIMVWTAEIRDMTLSDLIRGDQLLNLLRGGLHQGAYADEANALEDMLNELPPDDVNVLEAEVNEVIEEWAIRILDNPTFPMYVNVQPGWYVVDYKMAHTALRGGNKTYSADSPVRSEVHYMTLKGRIKRLKRQIQRYDKRVDLKERPLGARIETMILAMVEWDTKFPLPGLARYEKRIREIKHVLRSPWPSLGLYTKDEHGQRDYSSDQHWSKEEFTNRTQYTQLQQELLWLKWRVTKIYTTRTLSKSSTPSNAERSHLSCSEIPLSTEAGSR